MKRERKNKKLTFSKDKVRDVKPATNDQLAQAVGGLDTNHCVPQPCGMTYRW